MGDFGSFAGYGYGLSEAISNLIINGLGKFLHIKNEDIRGQKVPLSNSSSGVERGGLIPID